MSTAEDHKALIRRWYDLINRSDPLTGGVTAFLASNVVYHRPGMPDLKGLTEVSQVFEMYGSALPDQNGTIEDLLAESDKVACRFSWRGTHQGDMMGVAATGKAITVTGITIYRIASGKIQEAWDCFDVLGLMQQLGMGPLQAKG
jgi:steroid delta-isomerase-like uncharacterized protein